MSPQAFAVLLLAASGSAVPKGYQAVTRAAMEMNEKCVCLEGNEVSRDASGNIVSGR